MAVRDPAEAVAAGFADRMSGKEVVSRFPPGCAAAGRQAGLAACGRKVRQPWQQGAASCSTCRGRCRLRQHPALARMGESTDVHAGFAPDAMVESGIMDGSLA